LVGIVPLLLLGWKNIEHENKDIHREVNEKHQLLAQNLTFSISTYLEQILNDSKTLSSKYDAISLSKLTIQDLNFYPKFQSILILKDKELVAQQSIYQSDLNISEALLPKIDCVTRASIRQQAHFSSLFTNPLTKKPTMFVCQPIGQKNNILLSEIDLSYFYTLQKSIKFGRKGHAAIVNDFGQVVAHPNQNWVNEIKNISDWEIIQTTKAGKSGTMTFNSLHFNEEMISGYAGVPNFHWGVIVPQPISEVNEQIENITNTHLLWSIAALFLAIFLASIFTRKITHPIISLSREVATLKDNDFLGKLNTPQGQLPHEITTLSDSFQKVVQSFQVNHEKLKQSNEILNEEVNKATNDLLIANIKLQRVVTLDDLTNLYNRRGLQDILEHEVACVKRDDGSFTILLCDLDHFKLVNDNYGHGTGDNVLKTFANLAQSALRERDVVGRWGGEEFLCVLGDADYDTSIEIAERLRNLVADTVILPDEFGFNVTVSIGLATYPTDADTIDELLVCADNALYDAKHSGRNKTVACKRKQIGFQSVPNQLRCALAENAIKVAFQSLFEVNTKKRIAKRSMTRIICEKDKILSAKVYLSTAKQFKLMNHIDRLCLEAIIEETAEESNPSYYVISVSKEFLEKLSNCNEIIGLFRNNKSITLIFELSESEFNDNIYEAKKLLKPYIDAGVQLSLNDFYGSGVSLKFLTELPFRYVKISEDLLNNMQRNNRTMLAMRSALRMCKSLGIKSIASNVSDDKLIQVVEQMNFDWAQGYAYEKPILQIAKNKIIYV